ncbi:hypothetical protein EKN06_05960 [Croceicoccus ponticola]|uniref:Uncharacterized protein n=1 Tax=Croceicoccus ponticola TaxID=2217664 RepID=A0A437H279_9SPHN|nr:hypothetical protein [Croceicoccus ponticola]RVQ69699.1 hypothetical protein EKN06_05960 [Croceicoccus ponticola]
MAQGRSPNGERVAEDWRTKFLETLSRTSNVSAAARAAKIDASHVYRIRRTDPAFASAWFDALCDGYDMLEMELLRRLRLGDCENPGTKRKRKYDNATSFRLLTAHRDSVSRMRASQQHMNEEDIIASINAKLDLMRERMREAATADTPALPAPDETDRGNEA